MIKNVYKPFKWVGGKTAMMRHILPLLDVPHVTYCEPYAGSAALFFAKRPSPVEVLNDLNGLIVNFYRVLQSEAYKQLMEKINRTLYSRLDFTEALGVLRNPEADKIEKAWAFFVVLNQGYGAKELTPQEKPSWGYSLKVNQAAFFFKKINLMDKFRERVRNAQIDCMDALDFIKKWDSASTLFYLDPPYPLETRSNQEYSVDIDSNHIKNLIEILKNIKGQAILSTYPFAGFDALLDYGYYKQGFTKSQSLSGNSRRIKNEIDRRKIKASIVRMEVVYYRTKQNMLF